MRFFAKQKTLADRMWLPDIKVIDMKRNLDQANLSQRFLHHSCNWVDPSKCGTTGKIIWKTDWLRILFLKARISTCRNFSSKSLDANSPCGFCRHLFIPVHMVIQCISDTGKLFWIPPQPLLAKHWKNSYQSGWNSRQTDTEKRLEQKKHLLFSKANDKILQSDCRSFPVHVTQGCSKFSSHFP